jgi:YidC/Oxa1 family membrane protein insertase
MDKRTIWIVATCMGALVLLNWGVNKMYPPRPKKLSPVAAVSNVVAPVMSASINALAPAKEVPAVAVPVLSASPEEIVALNNEWIRVEFTSRGGGIRGVEMLQHKENGHGNVVLNAGATMPALALVGLAGADTNSVYTLERTGSNSVVMRAGGVTKTVTLGKDYGLTVSIEGVTAGTVGVVVGTAGPTHEKEAALYINADWQGGPKWSNRELSVVTKRTGKGENREMINARWVAAKSQYFAMVLTGGTPASGVTYEPVVLPMKEGWKLKEAPRGVMAVGEWPVSGGKVTFDLYAGPKEYGRLAAIGQAQDEVMDFGSWMDGYTGVFGNVLFKSLDFCNKLARNYGVAIILVTILLKIVLWPIQAKSIQSMKAMQKFQPQMAKLKEKYKDDQPRINQEMMKLYKEHKINPFSGCLPMMVQMPVLIAFYKVLSNAIEIRGVPFLWIKDLSQPDTIATIAGFGINPLPLVMIVSMIWQQKITPQTGDAQQQKMMMFMPVMMLFFFYTTASGLVLYWTIQQFLSIGQQWWSMRKTDNTDLVVAK